MRGFAASGFMRTVRLARLVLLMLGALWLWGCGSCKRTNEADAGTSPTSLLTNEQAAQVLARVGDSTITLGDYTAALENMDQFNRLRYQSPERRKELLDEMIHVKLLAMEAVAKGYDKDALAQQELRAVLRDAMLAEARKGAPTAADIPETDVRAWFESHRADHKDPERRRVSIISLPTEAEALKVLESAKNASDSAAWGELVRTKSIDSQARSNVPIDLAGDQGIVAPPGDPRGSNPRVADEVRTALFAIAEVGGIYERVVSAAGRFHVVRLTQKIPPHERSYEEVERSIRVKLAQDKLRAKEEELIAELKKSVKVEIDEASLASVVVKNAPAVAASGAPAASASSSPRR